MFGDRSTPRGKGRARSMTFQGVTEKMRVEVLQPKLKLGGWAEKIPVFEFLPGNYFLEQENKTMPPSRSIGVAGIGGIYRRLSIRLFRSIAGIWQWRL